MRFKGCFIAIAAAVLLLLGAGLFYFQARRHYEVRLVAQMWPKAETDAPVPFVRPGNTVVLLFGDSRVAQWGEPELRAGSVRNGGASGRTTGELLQRLPDWLEACHPKIVVIEAGMNDLKLLGLRPELRASVVSQSAANLQAMVDLCLQHHARVVLMPVWPPAEHLSLTRQLVWSPEVESARTDLNGRLQQAYAGNPNVIWFDILGELAKATPEKTPASLYRDDLHLKPETYSRLTPLLGRQLISQTQN